MGNYEHTKGGGVFGELLKYNERGIWGVMKNTREGYFGKWPDFGSPAKIKHDPRFAQ